MLWPEYLLYFCINTSIDKGDPKGLSSGVRKNHFFSSIISTANIVSCFTGSCLTNITLNLLSEIELSRRMHKYIHPSFIRPSVIRVKHGKYHKHDSNKTRHLPPLPPSLEPFPHAQAHEHHAKNGLYNAHCQSKKVDLSTPRYSFPNIFFSFNTSY